MFRWRSTKGKPCILGPNGAGKTTLFNLITGDTHADAGAVLFSATLSREQISAAYFGV